MHTFTGSYDESWFYLVPLSIELAGAPAIVAILEAQKAVLKNDAVKVQEALFIVADCIEHMSLLLKRMYERCDPAVFWKRIRQYSGGSKNSELFPDGVFYEGVSKVDFDLISDRQFCKYRVSQPSWIRGDLEKISWSICRTKPDDPYIRCRIRNRA